MIILGIDPGTARTGYGVIKSTQDNLTSLDYGCIFTEKSLPAPEILIKIAQELRHLIKKHQPDELAIEDIFFFKNLKTAFKVSQSQGVILLTAAQLKVPVSEYTPLQVKQAITGYGRADKTQVQEMVKRLLRLKQPLKPDDVADALAIAICHAHSWSLLKKQV